MVAPGGFQLLLTKDVCQSHPGGLPPCSCLGPAARLNQVVLAAGTALCNLCRDPGHSPTEADLREQEQVPDCVPGTGPALCGTPTHLSPRTTLGACYHPHFTDQETKGQVTGLAGGGARMQFRALFTLLSLRDLDSRRTPAWVSTSQPVSRDIFVSLTQTRRSPRDIVPDSARPHGS